MNSIGRPACFSWLKIEGGIQALVGAGNFVKLSGAKVLGVLYNLIYGVQKATFGILVSKI